MFIIHQFEKNKVLIYATAWMKLENMLNERSQKRTTFVMILFI